MEPVKTVIHIHTEYSSDCDVSLEALAWSVVNERIGCVAITDHDTIEGAVRFREMTDAEVIIGEEISTREGHLIGLFLQERIPPGLGVRETALAIWGAGWIGAGAASVCAGVFLWTSGPSGPHCGRDRRGRDQ